MGLLNVIVQDIYIRPIGFSVEQGIAPTPQLYVMVKKIVLMALTKQIVTTLSSAMDNEV